MAVFCRSCDFEGTRRCNAVQSSAFRKQSHIPTNHFRGAKKHHKWHARMQKARIKTFNVRVHPGFGKDASRPTTFALMRGLDRVLLQRDRIQALRKTLLLSIVQLCRHDSSSQL